MSTLKMGGLVLFLVVGSTIGWLVRPAAAQGDAQGLYLKMYEGGLITQTAFEQKTGESAPEIQSTAPYASEDAADGAEEPAVGTPELTEQILHRELDSEGFSTTVEQFRQSKREKLVARIPALFDRQRAEKQVADDIARTLDLPVRVKQKDGSVSELMAIQNGHPIFYTTYNIKAADTIGADEVWPGGSLGLSLSGTNHTLGMWDVAAVRTTHVEFSQGALSRVTLGDTYTNFTQYAHSTQVAGTMIAAGVNTNAKGMSFQSPLRAYRWDEDIAEMALAATSNDLRVSNHSYGLNTGWNIIELGDFYYWIWYGDVHVNTIEDYYFGFYSTNHSRMIDQTVYEASTYLPVWASGNERGGYNLGPPTQPAYHLYVVTNTLYETTNLVHNSDGYPGGYDLIPPQGTAKNVLTVGAVSNVPGGFTSPTNVFLASFSSTGPTDDGRIKPDVVAQGVDLYTTFNTSNTAYAAASGTSFASPSIAGSLNLLQQFYSEVRSTNRALLASTLKGLAIHTADDCGSVGPDYSFGWGLMNTPAATQLAVVPGNGASEVI